LWCDALAGSTTTASKSDVRRIGRRIGTERLCNINCSMRTAMQAPQVSSPQARLPEMKLCPQIAQFGIAGLPRLS
jgi:hypothetical protein